MLWGRRKERKRRKNREEEGGRQARETRGRGSRGRGKEDGDNEEQQADKMAVAMAGPKSSVTSTSLETAMVEHRYMQAALPRVEMLQQKACQPCLDISLALI